jgi:glutaredoxin-related protein
VCIASNLKKIKEFLKESDRKPSFPERSKWGTNKIGIKAKVQECQT